MRAELLMSWPKPATVLQPVSASSEPASEMSAARRKKIFAFKALPQLANIDPTKAHFALGGQQQAENDLCKCRFTASTGSGKGDRRAGLDAQTAMPDDPRIIVAIAETHIAEFNAGFGDRALPCRLTRRFRGSQGNICQALGMQPQHTEVNDLVDKTCGATDKLIRISHECDQHTG